MLIFAFVPAGWKVFGFRTLACRVIADVAASSS
jgi:hypothetical protein